MIFYCISELMLATLIQRYDKKIILFLIQFKNKRLSEILQAVRCTFYDCINTAYNLLNLSIKTSIFKEYGALSI